MKRYLATTLSSLSMVLVASGCGSSGPEIAKTQGRIVYKGAPVPNASVVFLPEDGGPFASAETNAEGTYFLTTQSLGSGAVLGKHRIMITEASDELPADLLPEDLAGKPAKATGPKIPSRYSSESTSGLSATVVEGTNVFDFELTDK
ncbi:hypothetical protein Pan216_44600 [Planctomycetes bacterium Pan216]|uniref:Carboxypeptidase regulatory-like domain-containing protein n=1 Tax=Kolteria novifilia TaxID=2527975 RepID=A0A518B9D1_9BACT|nr:hypothetical protein Pan216_44600 [Planctomycetes bacterium Pan216]